MKSCPDKGDVRLTEYMLRPFLCKSSSQTTREDQSLHNGFVKFTLCCIMDHICLIRVSARQIRHSSIQDSQDNPIISFICFTSLNSHIGHLSYVMAALPGLESSWVMDYTTACLIHSRFS